MAYSGGSALLRLASSLVPGQAGRQAGRQSDKNLSFGDLKKVLLLDGLTLFRKGDLHLVRCFLDDF